MKAKLVFHAKTIKGDEIVEVKIWQMPKSLDRPHGIKFSVVYVKGGKRLLGYSEERDVPEILTFSRAEGVIGRDRTKQPEDDASGGGWKR